LYDIYEAKGKIKTPKLDAHVALNCMI